MEEKIKSISKSNYKGKIYNLEVENDPTYFAENILVHNCRSLTVPITTYEVEESGGVKIDNWNQQNAKVGRPTGFKKDNKEELINE